LVLRPSRGLLYSSSLVGTQRGPRGGRLTSRRHASQRKHRTPTQWTPLTARYGNSTGSSSDTSTNIFFQISAHHPGGAK
jgi:hypothetical protein